MNWAQGPSQQGPVLQFQKQLIPSTRGQASRDEEGTSERYGKARAAQAEAGAIQPFKCQPFSLAVAAAGAGGSVLLFAVCAAQGCLLLRSLATDLQCTCGGWGHLSLSWVRGGM